MDLMLYILDLYLIVCCIAILGYRIYLEAIIRKESHTDKNENKNLILQVVIAFIVFLIPIISLYILTGGVGLPPSGTALDYVALVSRILVFITLYLMAPKN